MWGIQESLNRSEAPHALSPAEPANLRSADDHPHASTGFVQEGGRFEGTLPAANHENFLIGKRPEVFVIATMGHQRGRQTSKPRRPPCERRDAGGNDHTRRDQNIVVLGCQLESSCLPLDSGNPAGVEVGHLPLLIPAAIFNEAIKSNWFGKTLATCGGVGVETQRTDRIGNMRSFPGRTEEHAGGHILVPKGHGLTEAAHLQPWNCPQMNGG